MKSCATPLRPEDRARSWLGRFTHRHVLLAGGIALFTALLFTLTPSTDVEARRITLDLDTPLAAEPAEAIAAALAEPEAPAAPELPWQTATVRAGDSLYHIFKRRGLSIADLDRLLKSGPEARQLKRIHPGDEIHYAVDDNGLLLGLRYSPERLVTLDFRRELDSFVGQTLEQTPDVRLAYTQGTIDSSLFVAGANAGLPQSMIMELADIFSGVVDFVLDVRQGDHFGLIYEERFLDGEPIGYGRILAAYYTNRGDTHNAYFFQDQSGEPGYYNEDGVSMRKAFLRAPLDFTRISSRFNPRRLHPVFKTVRPHNGIDYAASRGTPVYAAGNGRVIEAGYSKPNGNYVFIQHGPKYVTKYLHLDRRTVSRGDRVKQRQMIGRVGSTGYATGPHLHYEFLINGVHHNPRTVVNELPKARSLAAKEREAFLASTQGLRTQLALLQQNRQLAQNDTDTP